MMQLAIGTEERAKLNDYQQGVLDGLFRYAWWKDGVLYVGTTGTTYAQAVDSYMHSWGLR